MMARAVVLGEAGVLRPGRLLWLRALGWMLALAAFVLIGFGVMATGIVTGGGLALGVNPQQPESLPWWLKMVAFVVPSLLILLGYVFVVRWGEKRAVSEVVSRGFAGELVAGLGIGAILMLLTGVLLWVSGAASFAPRAITGISSALTNAIQSGIVEELFFRLVLLRLLWRAFGVWPALAISALLFGLLHLLNPNASLFAAICIAFEAGILLAAFYILTGRIWMSIGVHAGWNFTQGWIMGAAVSGTSGFGGGPVAMTINPGAPEWLSGGGFGPEASLPGLLLCTAAGVSVLVRSQRLGRLGPA